MADNITHSPATPLAPGMIVRFPLEDAEREDHSFRDYRIGQILRIDVGAAIAHITFLAEEFAPDMSRPTSTQREVERPIRDLERCRILPDSVFTHMPSSTSGRILMSCEEEYCAGTLLDYYALLGGKVTRVSEGEIRVAGPRQDPDPIQLLLRYELHSPVWRFLRDQMVESYSELHSATFGIEDLVGSRVALLAHQAEVVARALRSAECRFMLADEVGLGKTIEACVILKGLRRRNSGIKALIVAPGSLTLQWRNELSGKFWLDFAIIRPGTQVPLANNAPGVIISHEDLSRHRELREWTYAQPWGLLIVDEAHQVRKQPTLHLHLCELSAAIAQVLILSATPIQRRADEYLSLLRLLDPRRYQALSEDSFREILMAQDSIRRKVAYLRPSLTPGSFDWDEFEEEAADLVTELSQDELLSSIFKQARAAADNPDLVIERAGELIAYVSENYRIEGRTIRNRRVNIDAPLPERTLDTGYSYVPNSEENDALEKLYDYVEAYLGAIGSSVLALEYARILLYAAASSPHALLDLIVQRQAHLAQGGPDTGDGDITLLISPAPPRDEQGRVYKLISTVPSFANERTLIEQLTRQIMYWRDQTDVVLGETRRQNLDRAVENRLGQVLRAVGDALSRDDETKVIIFSAWPQTIIALQPHLNRLFLSTTIARFTVDLDEGHLQQSANRIRSGGG